MMWWLLLLSSKNPCLNNTRRLRQELETVRDEYEAQKRAADTQIHQLSGEVHELRASLDVQEATTKGLRSEHDMLLRKKVC